jgi:hypothetical protein
MIASPTIVGGQPGVPGWLVMSIGARPWVMA